MTNPELQYALFQAAKVGHIRLMRDIIEYGGDPFALDESGRNAFFYSIQEAPKETAILLEELKRNKEAKNA